MISSQNGSAEERHFPWIKDGEKFALIGLDVPVEPEFTEMVLDDGMMALADRSFELPDYWKNWLGSIRVEQINECTLFLLAKCESQTVGIVDGEDKCLISKVGHWMMGLCLSQKISVTEGIFQAVGHCKDGKIDIRNFSSLVPPLGSIVSEFGPIGEERLISAANIAGGLHEITDKEAAYWRLLRCLHIYQEARSQRDILDRVHQFTRCIEGLIVPTQGNTKSQFKSRTELFIGPKHHELMGKLYDVRSDVEHLHENKLLEQFDRDQRIEIAKLEAVSEWIARSCLTRILLSPQLRAMFGNVMNLNSFWALDPEQRRMVWGDPVDPMDTAKQFNFSYITNSALGSRVQE